MRKYNPEELEQLLAEIRMLEAAYSEADADKSLMDEARLNISTATLQETGHEFRLVNVDLPYKKIMQGRKWVGRVIKTVDGRFYARIGKHYEAYAAVELDAFQQVVSLVLGFNNVNELHAHNSAVRRRHNNLRSVAKHAMSEIMRGNFKPLDELFKKVEQEP